MWKVLWTGVRLSSSPPNIFSNLLSIFFIYFNIMYRVIFMNIVPTDKSYTYDLLTQNLFTLNRAFPFLNIQVVGSSVLGKNLYVVKLGTGSKKVFYSASFHANEWITSVVMMKFIEDYCISYNNNSTLYNYSVQKLFNNVTIYIMPMVNPDGVDLVTGNIPKTSNSFVYTKNISKNFPDIPFPNRMESKHSSVQI